MGNEFRDIFRVKSEMEKRIQHGVRDARMISIKVRIAEWVKKVWNDFDDFALFNESRLLKEWGADRVTPYIRKELKKRGIDLGRRSVRRGRAFYVVEKCV